MAGTNTVRILDGNTFVVSEDTGDIEATPSEPTGLFAIDTRFLSRWVLTVNGERLNALSYDDLQYFETRFFLVPGLATHYIDAEVSVIRERAVGGGFRERLTDPQPRREGRRPGRCGSTPARDFADLFEVKDEILNKKGDYRRRGGRRPALGWATGGTSSGGRPSSRRPSPAKVDREGARPWTVHVEPNGSGTPPDRRETTAIGPGGRDLRMGLRAHGTSGMALEPTWRSGSTGRRSSTSEHDDAEHDVPAQPDRPGGAALLAADPRPGRRCRPPACPGS